MADKEAKPPEDSKINGDTMGADKENEPLLASDGEKKREERPEGIGSRDIIRLNIGEQYMVRRCDDTWRK